MIRILGLVLAILVASACTSLGRGPEGTLVGCPLALAEGTLKEVAPDKLALQTDHQVVARAGDRVLLTGGYLGENAFTQCDVVKVLPPAT